MIKAVFYALASVLIPAAFAYDGPVGVTFRAPAIERGAGTDGVALEGITVREKVWIDDHWSLKIDGRNRAFPDRFVATIADSKMVFRLRNQGNRPFKTNILIPYDASDKTGTGFTEPLHLAASLDGRPVSSFRGPELDKGMMRVRSFRVPVAISPGSTMTLTVTAAHHLAMNPAWYQFVCTDRYAKFPNYRSLTAGGCRLDFELELADQRLKEKPCKLQWKHAFEDKPLTGEQHETIRLSGKAIEWVKVFR